jgi:hypothetical protein
VIEEMIALAREMRGAYRRGEALGMSEDAIMSDHGSAPTTWPSWVRARAGLSGASR